MANHKSAEKRARQTKSRTVVIHRLDDEPPMVLRDDAVIENLPELPGFRCPVSDFFV